MHQTSIFLGVGQKIRSGAQEYDILQWSRMCIHTYSSCSHWKHADSRKTEVAMEDDSNPYAGYLSIIYVVSSGLLHAINISTATDHSTFCPTKLFN